jgi:hypothetical protein
VSLRAWFARTVVAVMILFSALVSVGLTAPADAPFAIRVRAIFLGLEVDIKVGTAHAGFSWSAIPLRQATTKRSAALL